MAAATEMAGGRGLPRLSWSAIIAGVALALAAHIVLGLIGAALGFAGAGAAAAIWALITPFVATLVGAWLAVRLAREWDEAGSNVHGVVVWAFGLVAGALFLTGTMSTGAMTAGTAASANAGMQRAAGVAPRDAQAERTQEQAARGAAAAAGGGAMAGLAGLLGAFAGAALARRREGEGLPFRISIQRRAGASGERATHAPQRAPSYQERAYVPPPARTEEATRDVTRSEGPGAPADPYQH